jgi:salicylate hydroxylase
VCLLGDAAHASSPSQAAGAGQGLEDALILSKLLGLVTSADQLETAFQVYDVIRRPRAQKVVQDSLVVSSIYYFMHSRFGSDLKKITADANERLPQIWWYDLERDVKKAEVMFAALAPLAEAGFVENGQDKGGARVEARVLDAELKAAL